jgi:hypothetical protein
MIKIFVSISLFLVIFPFKGYSQDLSFYTDLKLGNNINTVGNENFDCRLYFFVDESTCFTCMGSLNAITSNCAKIAHTQSILFVKSSGQDRIDGLKDKYKLEMPIIHDIASAYQNFYKVKNYPLMILTDKKGKIYYLGVPGHASLFNIELLLSEVKKIKDLNSKANNNSVIEIVSMVNLSTTDNLLGDLYFIKYFDSTKSYIAFNHSKGIVLKLDSIGTIIDSCSLNSLAGDFPIGMAYMSLGNIREDFIPFVQISQNAKIDLFYINLLTRTKFHICELKDVDWAIPYFNSLAINDSLVLVSLKPREQFINASENIFPSIAFINPKKRDIKYYGHYDSNIQRLKISNYYSQPLQVDKNNLIYEMQSPSDTIHRLLANGDELEPIKCSFDENSFNKNWKSLFDTLELTSNLESKKSISQFITSLHSLYGVLIDETTEDIYVCYDKKEKNSSGNIMRSYYLSIINRSKYNKDIPIPNYGVPFYIGNGIVFCIEGDKIKKYKLNI